VFKNRQRPATTEHVQELPLRLRLTGARLFRVSLGRPNEKRRQHLLEELKRNGEQLQQRLRRVRDAMTLFEATFPPTTAFEQDGPVLTPAQREAVADQALAFCHTVHEQVFGHGIKLFLQSPSTEDPLNHKLAVDLVRVASTGDRTAILERLAQLE
jgi:hypothetical protein